MTASGAATTLSVGQLWTYPVKSMVGEQVDAIALDDHGVVGDRQWATRDEERGGIRGAKKIGELMQFTARYVDQPGGHAAITCPDGTSFSTADADASSRLSTALGHAVTLWPLQPSEDLDHYRRGPSDGPDPLTELRAVFGREPDEPLPDLSIFPPEIIEFESPPGTYLDAFPLMLMTTSAMRSLRAALPESSVDIRRFRPSILIDSGDAPGHPEMDWAGRRLRVGAAELSTGDPCPRCVMVTRRIDDAAPADRRVLRHIVADLDQCVGVYATVTQAGAVRVGDPVELL